MKRDSNGNSVAVLGDGSQPEHHSHVAKSSPMDLKRRELQETKQYGTELAPDIDPRREKAVTRARKQNNVRPLDGHGA